jgi:hypothetical protein
MPNQAIESNFPRFIIITLKNIFINTVQKIYEQA